MMVNNYFKGCIYIILSAVIFGSMPLMAKNIYAAGVNAVSLVLLRNALALPVLYLLLRAKKVGVRPAKGDARRIVLLSLFGAVLTPSLLYYSYNYVSSGVATTLHFGYPIFVVLGCALFFRDKIGWIKGCCVLLCSLGMLLFYTPGETAQLFGAVLALASGVTYAVYIIYLDKSGMAKENAFKITFGMAAACTVMLGSAVVLSGNLTLPTTALSWLLSLVLAIAVMVGAVVLFQLGTAIVGPQRAAILSTFEPITGITFGIIAFDEPFGIKIALGSLLILAAVLLLTVFDNKPAEQPAPAIPKAQQPL